MEPVLKKNLKTSLPTDIAKDDTRLASGKFPGDDLQRGTISSYWPSGLICATHSAGLWESLFFSDPACCKRVAFAAPPSSGSLAAFAGRN